MIRALRRAASGALLLLLLTLTAVPGLASPAVAGALRSTLVIGTTYSPPYSTPEGTGLFDRLLEAALALLGMQLEMRLLPAERSLLDANAGIIDGDVGRVAEVGALYENLRRVPTPILKRRQFVAFSTCRDLPEGAWTALGDYHVGFVNGWKLFEPLVAGARSVTRVDNTEALFSLLARDRLDMALTARIDGLLEAQRLGLKRVCIVPPPIAEVSMYLFLHARHADLVDPLGAVLAAMEETGASDLIRQAVFAQYGLAAAGP